MKQKIKHIAILLFSITLIACNNNQNENKNSTEKTASLINENDSTIVIAEINNGVITFVADSTSLKNDWQNFITNQPDLGPCQLNQIAIVSDGTASPKYYLIVTGTMNNELIKSTLELEQGGPICWIVSGFTVTCTTTACSNEQLGCVPQLLACTPCGNIGKCTKTVVNNAVAIFPSIASSVCSN